MVVICFNLSILKRKTESSSKNPKFGITSFKLSEASKRFTILKSVIETSNVLTYLSPSKASLNLEI